MTSISIGGWSSHHRPNVADVVLPSLKGIADDYDDSKGYRKRMLLDRVLAVSNDVFVSDPVRAETRG